MFGVVTPAARALMSGGRPVAVGSTPTFIALTTVTKNTSSSSWTFPSISIGTAASDRYLIFGICVQDFSNTNAVTAVSIAPDVGSTISATRLGTVKDGGKDTVVEIWAALVPTGSTCDITITPLVITTNWDVCIGSAYGLSDLTVFDLERTETQSGTVTIDYPGNGLVIAIASRRNSSVTIAITGTGITSDFSNVDAGGSSNANCRMAFGHGIFDSAGSVTISGGAQGGTSGGLLAVALSFT